MSKFWKSVLFVAILTTVAVAYRVYSELAGPRFDEGLKKIEAEMKSKLPMKVDDATTLVDVKFEPTKTTYWYVTDIKQGETVDPNELKLHIQTQLCANADALRTIREKGFRYEYHYVSKERAVLADFTIADCP